MVFHEEEIANTAVMYFVNSDMEWGWSLKSKGHYIEIGGCSNWISREVIHMVAIDLIMENYSISMNSVKGRNWQSWPGLWTYFNSENLLYCKAVNV